MSVVSDTIRAAKAEGRAALIGYLPAGYPTVPGSVEVLNGMIDAGCDLVEIGIPYSDPVIDGPVIQAAATAALSGGFRLRDLFTVVEQVSAAGGKAVVMTYWNPVFHYGVDRFARDLAAAGGLGLITPDLVPDEGEDWLAASDAHGLDRIFLVAPSSTEERIASTAAATRGFLYATSTMGVTGARDAVASAAPTKRTVAAARNALMVFIRSPARSRRRPADRRARRRGRRRRGSRLDTARPHPGQEP